MTNCPDNERSAQEFNRTNQSGQFGNQMSNGIILYSPLSLSSGTGNKDTSFFDSVISEQINIGGTEFLIHKYVGTYNQGADDKTIPDYDYMNELQIQDLLLLENRDRCYDPNIYSIYGLTEVEQNDFDLSQWGIMGSADTIFVEFSISTMLTAIGRKIMSGDVIEVPYLRDDFMMSSDNIQQFGKSIPKLYKVEDASRAKDGYDPTWRPHLWRIKMSPITDSQEFRDILGDGDLADDLKNLVSTHGIEMRIHDAIVGEAESQVPNRNLEHAHLYVDGQHENGLPYLLMADGEPPNGAELVGRGDYFPAQAMDGTWFLRTDYEPNVLFKYESTKWVRTEVDYRHKFSVANRVLERFINNNNQVQTVDGMVSSRQAISKVLAPRVKPEIDNN